MQIFERKIDGGEAGIRTLGGFPLNGFQDRRFRPLSHLSATDGKNNNVKLRLLQLLFSRFVSRTYRCLNKAAKQRMTISRC